MDSFTKCTHEPNKLTNKSFQVVLSQHQERLSTSIRAPLRDTLSIPATASVGTKGRRMAPSAALTRLCSAPFSQASNKLCATSFAQRRAGWSWLTVEYHLPSSLTSGVPSPLARSRPASKYSHI